MEIESIEKETLDVMLESVKNLKIRIQNHFSQCSKLNLKQWLDAQEVCMILNISPRTLKSYREAGKIGFSQVNYKIFYKADEIQRFLNELNLK